MTYLSAAQVRLLLRDLHEGPNSGFGRTVTWRLPADVCVERMQERTGRLFEELDVGRRVRRDDRGWYFEPTPYPPDLYAERHCLAGDCEAAQRRLAVERNRPLDPIAGPLARASLLSFASGCAYLVVAVHDLAAPWCSPIGVAREVADAALREPVLALR